MTPPEKVLALTDDELRNVAGFYSDDCVGSAASLRSKAIAALDRDPDELVERIAEIIDPWPFQARYDGRAVAGQQREANRAKARAALAEIAAIGGKG